MRSSDRLWFEATLLDSLRADLILVDLHNALLHAKDVDINIFRKHILLIHVDGRVRSVNLPFHLALLVFSDALADLNS